MFTLKIRTENAAFEDSKGAEVARILRELADRVEHYFNRPDVGKVRDANGNTVGEWRLTK